MFSTSRKANGAAWLVLALCSVSSTRAADVIDINGSVAYREGTAEKGPWGEDLSEFNKLLDESPTAMGYFPFDWYNISTGPTALQNLDGWSWNITVKGDMPVAGVENAADYPKDQVYTAGKLSFQAPKELLKEDGSGLVVNDDWSMCILRWDLGGELYNLGLRQDRGECRNALTSECVEALAEQISPSIDASVRGGWCECPRADDVPACVASDRGSIGPWNSRCHAVELDAAKLSALAGGRVDLLAFASADLYAADNRTVYNDLGSLAWPVMAAQIAGDAGGFMFSYKTACVRAKDGVRGWDDPASNGTTPREMDGAPDGREAGKDGETEKDGDEVKDSAASGTEIQMLSTALFGVACLSWTLLV